MTFECQDAGFGMGECSWIWSRGSGFRHVKWKFSRTQIRVQRFQGINSRLGYWNILIK